MNIEASEILKVAKNAFRKSLYSKFMVSDSRSSII